MNSSSLCGFFMSGAPCPKQIMSGFSATSLRIERRFCETSVVKGTGGSFNPGSPVIRFIPLSTSPKIKHLSDSRQKAICPAECPGESSTRKPATMSPSCKRLATVCAGPDHMPPSTPKKPFISGLFASPRSIASASRSPQQSGTP